MRKPELLFPPTKPMLSVDQSAEWLVYTCAHLDRASINLHLVQGESDDCINRLAKKDGVVAKYL